MGASAAASLLLPVTIRGEVPGRAMRGSVDLRHFVYAFPISTPAANTRAPPSTTWKAARRNGVCM
ncbi:hypothetical protein FJ872_10150 [Mesorhizobium sp. B2-5-9]|nr:hypothetical protein FJ543_17255 [Mesorhizobium sp. B2-5-7]TPK20838.1 hypothetical protein FJ872_10150 [Mesorhizobium sp. B2-5-9]TPK82461.1 hypothetical protein FJ936_23455 [Mesorhizobium sp. B2-4-13]TPL82672.1 hypothetical protein FJ950_20140 [Mesorhizobium sp. B2-3-14]